MHQLPRYRERTAKMMSEQRSVDEHYDARSLRTRIQEALDRAGLGTSGLTWSDLSPIDQFHSRGLEATQDLAAALAPTRGASVLDVGCGIGGSARFLAANYGCTVTGIDLNREFVETAATLSERTGLAGATRFQHANALTLPFEDDSFDYVWTQHVSMNIHDRDRFYGEMFRVLKRSGRLGFHDIIGGNGEPLHFPVPWARTPDFSHLLNGDELRDELLKAGFAIDSWSDLTDETLAWQRERAQVVAGASQRPALGLHVVLGEEFPVRIGNMGRNLAEGRARVAMAIASKP
jgi:SAM-dependent methyltransferase